MKVPGISIEGKNTFQHYSEEEIKRMTFSAVRFRKDNKYAAVFYDEDNGIYLPIPMENSERVFFLKIPDDIMKEVFNHYLTKFLEENELKLVKIENSDHVKLTVKEKENNG